MQYDVTYSCGHTGIVNITGTESQREQKLRYYQSKLCPECYKKDLEARREAEREEMAAKTSSLPELTGTPKQINWAISIRGKFYETVRNPTTLTVSPNVSPEQTTLIEEVVKRYTEKHTEFFKNPDSKFWIESRDEIYHIAQEFNQWLTSELEKIL